MIARSRVARPRLPGRAAVWGTLTILCLLACSAGGDAPADLAVVFGEGGGITGRWHGYAIDAGGAVSEWEGPGLSTRTDRTPVGTLDPDDMLALWNEVETLGVLRDVRAEYGSMSRALLLTASGATHTFAWPTPVESDTLTAAQKLYAFCLSLATHETR